LCLPAGKLSANLPQMIRLLIATRNSHKVGEIRSILGEGFRCLTLNDFPGAPEVVEDAATFSGNARKKSEELAQWCWRSQELGTPGGEALYVLADDSGLEVDVLNGAPGVHSARFAALDTGQPGNSSTPDNNAKLLRLLERVPLEKRTARFRCALALTWVPLAANAAQESRASEPILQSKSFEGTCEGRIGFGPRGQGGFGYDPLFFPAGFDQTFAELGEAVKNRLSHRAEALARLRQFFINGGSCGVGAGAPPLDFPQ
jgi:XTP/dITP diphosphohydrolase